MTCLKLKIIPDCIKRSFNVHLTLLLVPAEDDTITCSKAQKNSLFPKKKNPSNFSKRFEYKIQSTLGLMERLTEKFEISGVRDNERIAYYLDYRLLYYLDYIVLH